MNFIFIWKIYFWIEIVLNPSDEIHYWIKIYRGSCSQSQVERHLGLLESPSPLKYYFFRCFFFSFFHLFSPMHIIFRYVFRFDIFSFGLLYTYEKNILSTIFFSGISLFFIKVKKIFHASLIPEEKKKWIIKICAHDVLI